jgi:hypothetical protein
MSTMEDNKQASGEQTGSSGEGKENTVSYETYQKVLNEAKKAKEALAEREKKIQDAEKMKLELQEAKMTSEGKLGELVETYKKKLMETEQTYAEKHKKYVSKRVTDSLSNLAMKHGCVDPDAFLKIADFSSISVDDEYNVDVKTAESIIESEKLKRQYLFKKDVKPVNDLPLSGGAAGLGAKPLDQMSKAEIEEQLRKLQG